VNVNSPEGRQAKLEVKSATGLPVGVYGHLISFCEITIYLFVDLTVTPSLPFSIWYDDRKDGIGSMNGTDRVNIKPGLRVSIVLKTDQRSGKLTEGIVKDILTKSPVHPHGIKVRLEDGQVGRVKEIKV